VRNFPEGFVWGAATSSYQIEGAWLEGGKGLSIWDAFAHTPGSIADGTTGDIACDHYHRVKEDVAMMASMGLKAYRFSIAWPRIQPSGRGVPNPAGLKFYSTLIDELLDHGITPWVTLHHWDLPVALQMSYGGWLHPDMPTFFQEYARICFEHFGDRVRHWITLNEPWIMAVAGYAQGNFPPNRISSDELYVVGHNLLRGHGQAVDLYRQKFQSTQRGVIGMSLNCDWREPLTENPLDVAAAERSVEFFLGWFADPLYRGDYPEVMRSRVGNRLPRFSSDDVARIKGSADFFGLNHYFTMRAADARGSSLPAAEQTSYPGVFSDQQIVLSMDPGWETTLLDWGIVPEGCRNLLRWIHRRYASPEIVITENGCALDDVIQRDAVNDPKRIVFLNDYLTACHNAIGDGVRLKGYFAWSLMDNFEWTAGYRPRFGLVYLDRNSGRRIPKASAAWYGEVMKRNGL
jgi:beta-galactosidase